MGNGDWIWDGGSLCLDLVNTFRSRKTGGWELLAQPEDLGQWLVVCGRVSGPRDVTEDQLGSARALREAINDCVDAVIARRSCPSAALARVNEWAAGLAAPRIQLRQTPGEPPVRVAVPPADPVHAALAEAAADAVRLLGGVDRDRLRVCASEDCGLRFVDRSNAGLRQWCSMRRCGNRAKVRYHRARQKG